MAISTYVWDLAREFAGNAVSPLFYIAILLIFLQYRQQGLLERKMFGLRVTSPFEQTLKSLVFGITGGIVATSLLSLLGVVLNPRDFTYIWVLAILFSLFQVRYICFAYAGGVLSLLSLSLHILPPLTFGHFFMATLYQDLLQLQVAHVLALVAVLHLVEALLVKVQGGQGAAPVFVQGKRGRLIGGFALQKYWVLPLAAIVVTGVPQSWQTPSWWGLLPLPILAGLQILPIPAVIGYSGMALAHDPHKKAGRTALALGVYAIVLLGLVVGSTYVNGLIWFAALFAPVAHEWIIFWERADEWNRIPLYVAPLKGLKILHVLPFGPAREMGLRSGEIIVKANGFPINTKYDLHFAINQNPAFIKLEVMDERGEVRFVQKPLYEGEHHGLAIILVPDDSSDYYVQTNSFSLWKAIWNRARNGKHYGTSA